MKYVIFAVEDDESIRDLYKYTFEPLGYECRTFNSAEDMFVELETTQPHIILLDVMLPGMDGFSATRAIREKYKNIAIILVSAKGDEINKVRGLDAGADDYISKPFGILELIARVKVAIRKLNIVSDEVKVIEWGEIRLNNSEHIVTVKGSVVKLTLKEFNLLKLLMSKMGNVVPRDLILNEVWGFEYYGKTRTLDMHVKSLRSKLAEFTSKDYIQTVRGVGYKFAVNLD